MVVIDDLQWADVDTVRWLEMVVADPELGGVLLLLLYRDDEIDQAPEAASLLESVAGLATDVVTVNLEPLDHSTVLQLVADVLDERPESVSNLVERLMGQADGNPLFILESVRSLVADGELEYSLEEQHWRWSAQGGEGTSVSDNVADLLAGRILKLGAAELEVVTTAAILGRTVDLEILGLACDLSSETVRERLQPAQEWGLVSVALEGDRDRVRFAHDRVQQAVIAAVPGNQERLHWDLGLRLLAGNVDDATADFAAVSLLNSGGWRSRTDEEVLELARRNFALGRKLRIEAAFDSALELLMIAADQATTVGAHSVVTAAQIELAEAALGAGRFDVLDGAVEEVLASDAGRAEQARVVSAAVQAQITRGRPGEGVRIGLGWLASVSVKVPSRPTSFDLVGPLLRTWFQLRGRSPEKLLLAQPMVDAEAREELVLSGRIGNAAYFTEPKVLAILILHMLELSLRYGNAAASCIAFATYGLMLCGPFRNPSKGAGFGQLAMSLLDRYQAAEVEAQTRFFVAFFIRHWHVPLDETIDELRATARRGVETGDLNYAGYAAAGVCMHSYESSVPLALVDRELDSRLSELRSYRQEIPFDWLTLLKQAVGCLRDPVRAESSEVGGDGPAREAGALRGLDVRLPVALRTVGAVSVVSAVRPGLGLGTAGAKVPRRCFGTVIERHFVAFEALAALGGDATPGRSRRRRAAANLRRLQRWRRLCPDNVGYLVDLVEAELARCRDQRLRAQEGFVRAIGGARRAGRLREEALALEMLGELHSDHGDRAAARGCWDEARRTYLLWGASAKVHQLDTVRQTAARELEVGAGKGAESSSRSATSTSDGVSLELESVLRTSQALSKNADPSSLLAEVVDDPAANRGSRAWRTGDSEGRRASGGSHRRPDVRGGVGPSRPSAGGV